MIWMPRFAYERGYGTGQVWLAHEMGHSFGLPHSSGPYRETYDSDWDPMSDGSVCSPSHVLYGCVGVFTNSYHMASFWAGSRLRASTRPRRPPTRT